MTKFNAIQFVAGLSIDFASEIEDLQKKLQGNNSGADNLDEMISDYRHLSSFLQGVDYMIDYLEDGETKTEIEAVSKTWHDMLQDYWQPLAERKATRDLGKPVSITTTFKADGVRSYSVRVDGREAIFSKSSEVRDYLKKLKD